MEPSSNGFSIREYTSKMRSIDVMKCWPFNSNSGQVSREDVESWLPPMTVPKYRWWSDELEAARSNQDDRETEEISRSETESVKSDKDDEKLEMVCPVCRDFNAATLTAVNAHIDGCLAQTMREERRQMRMMSLKSKSKPPKKRSIAEIFEVEEQPEIKTVLKFWPFNKDPGEVSITVTKFRWLSRRLEALRSNRVEGENSRNGSELAKSDEQNGVEDEKLEMVCPVCRVFSAATVTAVNAHIDGCLAQAMREERRQMRMNLKPKPKAPKKRSIAEILTVAPQIEAGTSEAIEADEDEEAGDMQEGYDDGGWGLSGADTAAIGSTNKSKKNTNKNRKKKKMKLSKKSMVGKHSASAVTVNNEKIIMMMKKKKRKKKKKNLFNNKLTPKKVDAYEHNMQALVNNSRKLKGTFGHKRVALEDKYSTHKRKSNSKFMSVEKKQKVRTAGKQQKTVTPVRGILKNCSAQISAKTSSYSIPDDTESGQYDIQVQNSDRHVRFSDKDDILSSEKRNSFDETMFNLSSDVLATSLSKEQSSGSDDEAAAFDACRSDENNGINIDQGSEVHHIVESTQCSDTSEQVTVQNFLRPCTDQEKFKHLSLSQVALHDNNLRLVDGGSATKMDCLSYGGISSPHSAPQAGHFSSINAQDSDSGSFSSAGKFIDHSEDPTSKVTAMNSNVNTRTFLQSSSSYPASFDKANGRTLLRTQLHGANDKNDQALGCRSLSHMLSAEMIDNLHPFPGWGKGSVRNNCMDGNFYGLPLNSHGELINFSSGGKGGMNHFETSSMLGGSSSCFPVNNAVYPGSQDFLRLDDPHFVPKTLPKDHVNPLPHYPARLGVTDMQGSERADTHGPNSESCSNRNIRSLDSELNLMKNPFIEQNQHDQLKNLKVNEMISSKESSDNTSLSYSQPTMRLMGKDVPIGRSNNEMQHFVEGNVWGAEESRRRHYSEDVALANSLLERCSKKDWVSSSTSQLSTENMTQSVKIQSNQALESTLLMNGPDSEFPRPFIDFHTNYVSQNGSLGVSRNASPHLHPITHAPSSCAVFNRAPDLSEQFISGAKPLGLSSQLQVPPTHCNFSQRTCLSNGELHDRKNLTQVAKSAFEFPFLHPGVGEHTKTSWFERTHRSLPPWLLTSTHNKSPGTSQQFSGTSYSFSQNIWGGNFTAPSVNHSAEVVHSNPLTSHCQTKSPLCPASIVQPALVPVIPAIKPASTINSGSRSKIKVTDRMMLDDMTTKDHQPFKNAQKRRTTNLDNSAKRIELPSIEVQENSSRMIGLTQKKSSSELQQNPRAVQLDPHGDDARTKCCCQNEAQNRSYPGIDSFKLDGMVIPGAVRQSPGAKPILKPSQSIDQDNSRPNHSAIPMDPMTDRVRDVEIQRKLTKIYRF